MIDREKIERLAAVAALKEEVGRYHAMANTPSDYEERVKAKQQYAVARAEAWEAREELERAIRGEA